MGHFWPAGETPFKWRFAGWPVVARFYVLTGMRHAVVDLHGKVSVKKTTDLFR